MAELGKGKNIAVWVLSALLAALFAIAAGPPKIIGAAEAVEGFTRYGYSATFRVFIGLCEVAGGIGLLIPPLATWAAGGLIVIMGGAVYALLVNGEGTVVPIPLVVAALLVVIALARRGQALGLSSR